MTFTGTIPIPNRLATCSYKEYGEHMGVLVGTSTGNCRQRSGVRYARSMAPYSIFRKVEDPEMALPIYWKQLDDDRGKIEAELQALARDYPDQVLVFACFEDLGKAGLFCHRTWLAQWFTSRYGVEVTEFGRTRATA